MPSLYGYFSKINPNNPNLDAPWVLIERAKPRYATKVWRCVLVHSLTAAENGSQHNLFLDVLDANGRLLLRPDAMVAWTWQGRDEVTQPAPPKAFDKQPPEPLSNLDIYHGQIVSLWLSGQYPSDIVSNLRSDPPTPDEQFNTLFHKSTYLVFQLQDVIAPTIDNPPTIPTTGTLTMEERMQRVERKLGLL